MNKHVKTAVMVVFTALSLIFLFSSVTLQELIQIGNKLTVVAIVLSLLFYGIGHVARTKRLSVLFPRISFKEAFSVVTIHTFWINTLPFRTGDLSYLYLLHDKGYKLSTSAASFIAVRLLDTIAILLLFLVSALFVLVPAPYSQLKIPGIFLLALALVFGVLFFFGKGTFFERLLNKVPVDALRRKLFHLHEALMDQRKTTTRSATAWLFFYTLLVWIMNHAVVFAVLQDAGIAITFWQVIFVDSILIVVSLFPVTFLGLGVFEVTMAGTLVLFAIEQANAVEIAFLIHIVLLLLSFVYGLVGFMLRSLHREKKN